jgi:hypothetical protein
MANTYHQIYLQIIFVVKYREAVIFGVIGNLINEANCKNIIVGGVEDHEHCLIGLKRICTVPTALTLLAVLIVNGLKPVCYDIGEPMALRKCAMALTLPGRLAFLTGKICYYHIGDGTLNLLT